jgi:hypothetical protein
MGPDWPASPATDSQGGPRCAGGTYSKPNKECKVLEAASAPGCGLARMPDWPPATSGYPVDSWVESCDTDVQGQPCRGMAVESGARQ